MVSLQFLLKVLRHHSLLIQYRVTKEFKGNQAQANNLINSLKAKMSLEKEWKEYYRKCHETYENEYSKAKELI